MPTLLAYPDKTLAATLSGGSWETSLPLNNLKSELLSKVARSVNATEAFTQFVVSFGAEQTARVVALLNHNLSLAGRVRFRGYSHSPLDGDLITNGGFDSDSWWAKSTGVSISGGFGVFTNVASGLGFLKEGIVVEGRSYKITFTLATVTQGGVRLRMYDTADSTKITQGEIRTAPGTYTETLTAVGDRFGIRANNTTTATIDNVSMVEIPIYDSGARKNWLPYSAIDSSWITVSSYGSFSGSVIVNNRGVAVTPFLADTSLNAHRLNSSAGLTTGPLGTEVVQYSFYFYVPVASDISTIWVRLRSNGGSGSGAKITLNSSGTVTNTTGIVSFGTYAPSNHSDFTINNLGNGFYQFIGNGAASILQEDFAEKIDIGISSTDYESIEGTANSYAYFWDAHMGDPTTEVIDTTSVVVTAFDKKAWPESFTADNVAEYPNNFILPILEASAQYWKVEIQDTANADEYIEIGRCWIGPAFEPATGIANGLSLGYVSGDVVSKSIGGVLWGDRRDQRRLVVCTFDTLNAEEKRSALIMQKTLGKIGQLLYVQDANASAEDMLLEAFPGTIENLSPLDYPYYSNNTLPIGIIESV